MPDVVVTGVGAVTPYGTGVDVLWDGLVAGRATAERITRFEPDDLPVRFACEVPGFDPVRHLPPRLLRQLDPFAQYALVAAEEALTQAGLLDVVTRGRLRAPLEEVDLDRAGAIVASGAGGIQETVEQLERLRTGGPGRVRPYLSIAQPASMAGAQLAIRHGLGGPNYAVSSACASAGDAIGAALDVIRSGRADVMVAGGAEAAITPLMLAAFAAAGSLSRRNDAPASASRPFDADRDGFVMGEGAGVLVLERAEHAAARRARPLATLAGYGATNDAHHAARPPSDGAGAARALRLALADAGIGPDDLDHVNAHGTATVANDRAEAAAVRAVLDGHADAVTVTSVKSAVGHLLGAAGGLEAVVTVRTLGTGLVPPTQNLDDRDPACDLDVVHGVARLQHPVVAVSNSFGFGGHNSVLAFVR